MKGAVGLAVAVIVVLGLGLGTLADSVASQNDREVQLYEDVAVLRHQQEVLVRWVRVELRPWVIQQAEETAEAIDPPHEPPNVEPLPTVPPEALSPTPEPLPSASVEPLPSPTVEPSLEPSPTCIPLVDICVGESPAAEAAGGGEG